MEEQEFSEFLSRSLERGGPPIDTKLIPQGIKDQIVHMVLMGPHIGPLMGIPEARFEFDVNDDDEICRIEWSRDGRKTIYLVADGSWFVVYQGVERTTVFKYDEKLQDVDTETMEAIMLIAGVHPTQVG